MMKLNTLFQTIVAMFATIVVGFNAVRSVIQEVDAVIIVLLFMLTFIAGTLTAKSFKELLEGK